MKSALFVDFDNVYSGLRRLDQETADHFARNPSAWMNWLVQSLPLPEPASPDAKRRVLVRRCYLNPQAYQRFRPAFNIAGFEIIDCPALTSEGKTSTDIHMVLDIVDLLQHEARYDEFIVFSADADFTPVLRKLRRSDRRTTVLAIGFPSAAYRASADLLIDQDEFVRKALGVTESGLPGLATEADSSGVEVRLEVRRLVQQTVKEGSGPVSLAKLASLLLAQVDGLDAASWGGFGSFRGLLESLEMSPLVTTWENGGTIHDPKRHRLSPQKSPGANEPKTGSLMSKAAETIKEEVSRSLQPVQCGRLATKVLELDSALAADWAGRGTFRKFVEALDLGNIYLDWNSSGGVAYDPSRHNGRVATMEVPASEWEVPELYKIARQIHEATDAPLLTPRKYGNLFGIIAADVAASPFHLMETGKRVRDRCRESGHPVSRADVNQVLRGLLMSGYSFDDGPNDAATLGQKHVDNVRALCLREQIVLDEATNMAIHDWILGRRD